MTTTSASLLAVVVSILSAAGTTDAGLQVFSPGDWPTQSDQYPRLKARVIRETKQSLGRGGGPAFTVVGTVRIIGEVSTPVQFDDAGAATAAAALWQLARQVEVAVIGNDALWRAGVQQFSSVDSQLAYNSDGETHLAGIQIDIGLEFYQGPEDFAQTTSTDLDEVVTNWPAFPPTGFAADLTR